MKILIKLFKFTGVLKKTELIQGHYQQYIPRTWHPVYILVVLITFVLITIDQFINNVKEMFKLFTKGEHYEEYVK